MSYDLSIWCCEPFHDPALLPSSEQWRLDEGHWSFATKNWSLDMGPSDRVLEEDIPEEVFGRLPGIAHLVGISLHPIDAPKAARSMMRRVAQAVAKEATGVILDQHQGSIELPRGVKRFLPPKREKVARTALLEMSWWMTNARLTEERHQEALLRLFDTYLPEALPRRYGLYEPPQHLYADTGRDHLKTFLAKHMAEVVWYANRPVSELHVSVEQESGWQPASGSKQFRCNQLSISIDSEALIQPGWREGLHRFWKELSVLLQPFFGDVRTLAGYVGRPPSLSIDHKTEHHPVASWWWKGVPPKLGHAVVIGEPYLSIWPSASRLEDKREGLVFASTGDWCSSVDASELLTVPSKIALPFMPSMQCESGGWSMRYPDTYPEQFPFRS